MRLIDWFLWFRFPVLFLAILMHSNPSPRVVALITADFAITFFLRVFD